ncbi:hypothetical protein chiPu_0008364 [Chiloscyllium punctatum]|uniref:Uncharacterized protein n=1 Tax=Chiloscyllium punctatum TaxID=137246 RepID=A0A401SHU7_CHIPU|nr:hypothetical protein [Chiloscyllium punctatum]
MFRHQFLFEPLTSHAWNQDRTQKVLNPKNHGVHLYKKSGNQRIENHELKEHNGQIIGQEILQPTETNSTTWSAPVCVCTRTPARRDACARPEPALVRARGCRSRIPTVPSPPGDRIRVDCPESANSNPITDSPRQVL